jgi:DNA segregation ATPase FtsK/SpoIIIE, S-DNA-T family
LSPANAEPTPKIERKLERLPPGKGREVWGVTLVAVALLLAASLVSHRPVDPSFLHEASGLEDGTANWIGPFGANLSAFGFGFFGLPVLVVPLVLLVAGVRRLRPPVERKQIGRGLGALVLLGSLPALLQLTVGSFAYRGDLLRSGGAFGEIFGGFLLARLNLLGALLVLGTLTVIGAALLLQSTLGEVLGLWRGRWRAWREQKRLERERKLEQKEKKAREAERQRVIDRHRDRLAEKEAAAREALVAEAGLAPPDGAVRVIERHGSPGFGVRRVTTAAPAPTTDLPLALDDFLLDDPPPRASQPIGPPPSPVAAPRPATAYAQPAEARPVAALVHKAEGARKAEGRKPAAEPQPVLPFAPAEPGTGLPPLNLLQLTDEKSKIDENELVRLGEVIRQRCEEFGVEGSIEGISPGPVITIYELQPAPGVKVSHVVNLQDDLALALRAESVRIDRLAGRSTLGLEVPNRERQTIRLGSLLAKESFGRAPSPLTMALGVTIHGEPYFADLATMPHLLVAGATGAGKSVGLQSMITSVLYKARPDEAQFIMIDPKRIELGVYTDVPHLRTPVVVEPKQAANVLNHMVAEMESRYKKLAKVHVRSIAHYNQAICDPEHRRRLALGDGDVDEEFGDLAPLPYIVVIIDELADLMMVASSDVETAIARLAQMARAVGIHLIVATQRPSVDVLTGTIKANFPCRIAYATASRHDSRTILDQVGSERLLGKGDMLFMPPGSSRIMRLHGAYVSEQETAALVRWLKKQGKPNYDLAILEPIEGERGSSGDSDNDDDLFDEAARLVVAERMASASFLQRRMRIGFSRASRLIDMMERDGLVGSPQGSKPREVLVPRDYFAEVDLARVDD